MGPRISMSLSEGKRLSSVDVAYALQQNVAYSCLLVQSVLHCCELAGCKLAVSRLGTSISSW